MWNWESGVSSLCRESVGSAYHILVHKAHRADNEVGMLGDAMRDEIRDEMRWWVFDIFFFVALENEQFLGPAPS